MAHLASADGADWIPAGPFRAYVRHLLDAADLPWAALAVLSDVPAAQLRSLLFGRRSGRPLRRLHPQTAARLLAIDSAQLRTLRYSRTDARATRGLLISLVEQGWSTTALARAAELSLSDLRLIMAGASTEVTHRTAVLIETHALLNLPPHLRRHACEDELVAA